MLNILLISEALPLALPGSEWRNQECHKNIAQKPVSDKAVLSLPDGQTIELPVITGTENEKAIDISKLRSQTGYITMDPGYGNTGSCESSITFLDGEKGILRYRGIPIEQLAAKASFVEVAYLIIYGKLPNQKELDAFTGQSESPCLAA